MPSHLFTPPRNPSQSNGEPSSSSTASSRRFLRTSGAVRSPSSPFTSVESPSPNVPAASAPQQTESFFRKCCNRLHWCWNTKRAIRWLLVTFCFSLAIHIWTQPRHDPPLQEVFTNDHFSDNLRPLGPSYDSSHTNPEKWLKENSNDVHAVVDAEGRIKADRGLWSSQPRAAIISLVRNEELEGIMQSMRQLELRWNRRYRYPWIFFNEKPFSEEFKAATSNLTFAQCFYEVVPVEHWSTPAWIDQERYMNSLDYLGAIGVGKGWMLSYRNMCRWNSGFFYKHPWLKEYDFYWRVEPDVHFFCDISYDVFRFMAETNLKYGFNMNILDDARSFPSLWTQTRDFINSHPDLLHPDADLDWLLDFTGDYNNCQFFSNFEIGDLRFFRTAQNEAYFDHLDKGGGFYYERFGDAPIHTLSLALFASKREVWFFRDIGYQHDIARHCPPNASDRCACEPTSLDENFYKLVPMESPQQKPVDTCIRQWLGGEWLKKKDGWDQQAERAFGGDGYAGYVQDGV